MPMGITRIWEGKNFVADHGSLISGENSGAGNADRFRVLSGWKEIAAYLGRGVRTVQRWEKLGLPVRRPNAHLRSAVLTSTEEIDTWVRGCGDGRLTAKVPHEDYEALRQTVERLQRETAELRREVEGLKRRVRGPHAARNAPDQSTSSQWHDA